MAWAEQTSKGTNTNNLRAISVLGLKPFWFERLSASKEPSLRLFCFPYAGGSADIYRRWRWWLPHQIELCLAHLPGRGRDMGGQAFTQLMPLVKAVTDCIDHETNAPYCLYGHSMGALISFEVARELFRRHRAGLRHLFVSGRRAPQWPRKERKTFDLPRDRFLDELKRLDGTPLEVLHDPQLMEVFIDVLRADFEVVETYKYNPGERLPCPITVYGGLQDEDVSVESCEAWRRQTSVVCKVRMFPGDHFFIRNPLGDFIAALRGDLLSAVPELHPESL
jgi:medium-chain acyl-[acyl-carrier-protein] hydrolase